MQKLPAMRILLLLAGGIFIWVFEAGIHVINSPHRSFRELMFDTSPHEVHTRLVICIAIILLFVAHSRKKNIAEQRAENESIFNNVIPICITGLDCQIIKANNAYWRTWGRVGQRAIKCHEHRPGKYCHTEHCALTQVVNGAKQYTCESHKKSNDEEKYFLVTATPYFDSDRRLIGVIETFQDITAQKHLHHENEKLINKLQESLEKVKLLSGILPICASCKQIKDDRGVWGRIEDYIATHSEAKFSHGICPDCAEKLYPDISLSIINSKTGQRKTSSQPHKEKGRLVTS